MPELPEVESVRTDLLVLCGTTLTALTASRYQRFASAIDASGRVIDVSRRGKWLVIHLATPLGPYDLVIHLGMTGRVVLSQLPRALPHLHASWQVVGLENISWMGFSDPRRFGRLAWAPHGQYVDLPGLRRIGPDATDASAVEAALGDLANSARPVKAALLDQAVIAGAGNIYCDEALFASRIDPTRPVGTLTASERGSLARHLAKILHRSIAAGGTTFRDYRRADGSSGSNIENLLVYGRSGAACFACGEVLHTAKVAGRTTVWCVACQH